jgi:Gpi18-like mannosyltransferase
MIITTNKTLYFLSALLGGLILTISLLSYEPILTYSIANISSSLIYIYVCWLIFKLELQDKTILILIAAFVLLRLIFINTIPIGSDDIYRYMWDGKQQANGINPYLYTPNNLELSSLHTDILPGKVNFPHMKTIYFPFSQWLFYLGYLLSGEHVWGYKLLLLIAELLTIYSLYKLIKHFGYDLKYILLYVLSPLSIIHFALDAHLDAFGFPLILFSLLFYLNNKKIISSVLLGLSLSIKPIGLIFLPIFFLKEKGIKNKIIIIVSPLIVFFVQFVPYIFSSSNPFEAFLIYTKNWTFNGFVFNLLNIYFVDNQISRLISACLLAAALLPVYFGKRNIIDKIFYSALFMIIFSPVVHPWYIGWIAILIPLARKWSGVFLVSLSSLTVITVLHFQIYGYWKDYLPVLLLEYLPVLYFLARELFYKYRHI